MYKSDKRRYGIFQIVNHVVFGFSKPPPDPPCQILSYFCLSQSISHLRVVLLYFPPQPDDQDDDAFHPLPTLNVTCYPNATEMFVPSLFKQKYKFLTTVIRPTRPRL